MKKSDFNLKVKKAAYGLGLFAMEPIPKGIRIIEYTGEKITVDEANRRGGMYLFEITSKWYIDGKGRQNTARYINHACRGAANCDIEIKGGRIWVFAKKNIEAGEELAYDYGKEMFNAYIKPHGCRCAKCKAAV
jgi:SET domain-containing protein